MRTQPRIVWNGNFETKEQYAAYRAEWKKYFHDDKYDSSWPFLLDAILRGRDWKKVFADTSDIRTIVRAFDYLTNVWGWKFKIEPKFGQYITRERLLAAVARTRIPETMDEFIASDAYTEE